MTTAHESVHSGYRNEDVAEIGTLIKHVKVAMLTTRTAAGKLVSRPLHTREVAFDGTLWFFTGRDTGKVEEIEASPEVNVAYVDAGKGAYVSIDGTAHVVRDAAKVEQLWSEAFDSLYFKGGKTDPNLVLIKVDAHGAEVWTSASTAIGRVFNLLKAKATGDIADLGEQKHVPLG